MAKAKVAKQPSGRAPITAEEKSLLDMYRGISRWERNCFFTILQSVAYGGLTSKTDRYSWEKLSRRKGLPEGGKEVAHEI